MSKLIFEPEQTEGHHPTAFAFKDTELRKDEKAVTTRLENCYDVKITNPVNDEIIKYDESIKKWVNGQGGGGGDCNVVRGHLTLYVIGDPQFTGGDWQG